MFSRSLHSQLITVLLHSKHDDSNKMNLLQSQAQAEGVLRGRNVRQWASVLVVGGQQIAQICDYLLFGKTFLNQYLPQNTINLKSAKRAMLYSSLPES